MARLTANALAQQYKEIAEKASSQVDCDKQFTGWMVSLMKAIQVDREYEYGLGVQGLAELGLYLAETHADQTEQACAELNNSLDQAGGSQ